MATSGGAGGGPGGGSGGGPGGHRRQESMYALTGLYADASNSSGSDGERDTGRRDILVPGHLPTKTTSDTPFHKGHSRNASLGE